MKQRVWLTWLVWLAASTPCAAEMLEAESRITAVTVFPDRAGVTRTATLDLEPGAHTVEIGPLPSQLEPQSVTVKGAGRAEVTLYGVRLATRQLETAQDPKVQTLEEQIRQAERRQRQLQILKRTLEQEREYLSSIQAASSEQIGKDLITKSPSASDAAALLTFLDEGLLKVAERDQAADDELEAVARQLDKLRRELAELTQGRFRQETTALVDLEARKGGAFTLELSYRTPGASWQPAYEARAATDGGRVELVSYGLVRQRTGEDWTDVLITLSTAKPAMSGTLPKLQPVFLRPWESRVPASAPDTKKIAGALLSQLAYRDQAAGSKEAEAPQDTDEQAATMAAAAIGTQGPAVTYRLPKAETVPADWQPHKMPIGSQAFQASLMYGTTPRLLPYAFLRARVKNTAGQFFLSGPVSVFLDGAFIATAVLEQIAPEEEFDLYLGVDERVKVERQELKERVEVSLLPGLRGKTKSTDYEQLTTIENFTGRRIHVTVFDQVPVSQREEIVVDSVRQSPPNVEPDLEQRPGVFRWEIDLAPSQKQELRLSYRVRHPVDMQIQ